jgi:hypothetical protein
VAAGAQVLATVDREQEVRPGVRGLGPDQVDGVQQVVDLAADAFRLFDKDADQPIARAFSRSLSTAATRVSLSPDP